MNHVKAYDVGIPCCACSAAVDSALVPRGIQRSSHVGRPRRGSHTSKASVNCAEISVCRSWPAAMRRLANPVGPAVSVRINVAQEPMATPRAHPVPPKKAVATPHASLNARVEIGRNGAQTLSCARTRSSLRPIRTAAASHVRTGRQPYRATCCHAAGPPAATRVRVSIAHDPEAGHPDHAPHPHPWHQ